MTNHNNEEIKYLTERVLNIVSELGYSNWTLICFTPFKAMDEKLVDFKVFSGFTTKEDIYTYGDILVSMLHKLADEGYVKRNEDKSNEANRHHVGDNRSNL